MNFFNFLLTFEVYSYSAALERFNFEFIGGGGMKWESVFVPSQTLRLLPAPKVLTWPGLRRTVSNFCTLVHAWHPIKQVAISKQYKVI